MADQSIVILGLPESGKTTFLAALWHLVSERDIDTTLGFHRLEKGDSSHLNKLAARWREARVQDRTEITGNKVVSMSLRDNEMRTVRITFPDVPGEAYRRMWEYRDCEDEVAEFLATGGVLLFVHTNTICQPLWVKDEVDQTKMLGLPVATNEPVAWSPVHAPTQVQLIDLLQLLRLEPLDSGPRKLAIMLSAWDTVQDHHTPETFLSIKLPMLSQYLQCNFDEWDWRTYGLSAQGGQYDPVDPEKEKVLEAETLRQLDRPSNRILLVHGASRSHDLTEPLAWLMA